MAEEQPEGWVEIKSGDGFAVEELKVPYGRFLKLYNGELEDGGVYKYAAPQIFFYPFAIRTVR